MGILRQAISTVLALALALPAMAANKEDARMMVHLLDYIAVDYTMAVQNGEVISVSEYDEMLEFARTIKSLSTDAPSAIQSDILLLSELVDNKASSEKISSVASGIKQHVITHYNLEIAPKRWPQIKNGAKLFALHCQSCHGATGLGNGPLAAGLDPSPTNFHEPDKANGLSPFQAYNTIRLGVNNTGMRAFNELSDDEAWDLAFYVLSLPHQKSEVTLDMVQDELQGKADLSTLASNNNEELISNLALDSLKPSLVSALRLYPQDLAPNTGEVNYLAKARNWVDEAIAAYKNGNADEARTLALTAYLEGVEPVEVQLRANDASLVANIESSMSRMRSAIENGKSLELVQQHAEASKQLLSDAEVMLGEKNFSGWLAFLLSASIILREGLEAFLVVITVLGIIRSLKIKNGAAWVHSGWMAAIAAGFLLWLAADNLFNFSGAQREVMEGAIALFAVGVLLYVGFWMHSKSEANKWQAYVKTKIQGLARKENMLGLAFLSFLVVFREAFESVLFLSALNMEAGEEHQTAFVGGILAAFVALFAISALMLKYSKKIPITQLFKYSALVISFLAVVLVGKGVSALQEAGLIGITSTPFNLRSNLFGIYPAWEPILSQVFIIALIIFLWNLGNKAMKKPICETEKDKINTAKVEKEVIH